MLKFTMVLSLVASGVAAGPVGAQSVAAYKGQCTRFQISGRNYSASCEPRLAMVSTGTKSRRVAIIYTIGSYAIVQFSGAATARRRLDRNEVEQVIDRVTFTRLGGRAGPIVNSVEGSCLITVRSRFSKEITCAAGQGDEMIWTGNFVTAGEPAYLDR